MQLMSFRKFMWMLLVILPSGINGQRLPVYNGSFRASGEFTRNAGEDMEVELFEEVYDAFEQKAALRIVKNKDAFTLLQDFRTKHNFWIRTKDGKTTCTLVGDNDLDRERWNKILTMVKAPDGLTYILLRELLVLGQKVAVQTREDEVVRSMFCKVFGFHYDKPKGRDNAAMTWTANEYPTEHAYPDESSERTITKRIPTTTQPPAMPRARPPPGITDLRSAMKTLINETLPVPWYLVLLLEDGYYYTRTIRMSIFDFDYIQEPFVNELLEVPEGVFCKGYYNREVNKPVYYNLKTFEYHAMVRSTKHSRHRVVHGWIDVHRRLYKIRYLPFSGAQSSPITLIVSGLEGMNGIVYNMSENNPKGCEIMNSTDLEFDKQMIIVPKAMKAITTSTFFTGPNRSASLNYIKRTRKGGVPCHLWTILRNDWPFEGVETMWEWCFINPKLQDPTKNGVSSYVVSLDIHVRSVSKKESEKLVPLSPEEIISFQFYHFNYQDAELMQLTSFDVAPCYSRENSVHLQFKILGRNTSAELLRNPAFLLNASKEIARVANLLKAPALRVTNMKGDTDNNQYFVTSTLVGKHSFSSAEDIDLKNSLEKLLYHTNRNNTKFTYKNEEYRITNVCYKTI